MPPVAAVPGCSGEARLAPQPLTIHRSGAARHALCRSPRLTRDEPPLLDGDDRQQKDRVELEQRAGGDEHVGEPEAPALGGPQRGQCYQRRHDVEAREQRRGGRQQQIARIPYRAAAIGEAEEAEIAQHDQRPHPEREGAVVVVGRRQQREAERQHSQRRILGGQRMQQRAVGPEGQRVLVVFVYVTVGQAPQRGERLRQPQREGQHAKLERAGSQPAATGARGRGFRGGWVRGLRH
ncbi:MAG TPA: hypothetical protein VFU88_07445 [Ktedonobacterales bacterium]|nr:hypothetical protein [Ktedonobacterales bacterium]